MGFGVYILFSEKLGKYYVGHTGDLEQRLEAHNNGKARFTSTGVPWKLVHFFECSDKSEAARLELTVKKRGIERYLQDKQVL